MIAAILVAAVCLSGGATFFLYYDKATTPDRHTPGVTVRQYLQITFDDRNSANASQFTCGKPSDVVEIQQLLTEVEDREARYNIHISVSWRGFSEQTNRATATVLVNILIQVPEANGSVSESVQVWRFVVQDHSGWRVCQAHRTG